MGLSTRVVFFGCLSLWVVDRSYYHKAGQPIGLHDEAYKYGCGFLFLIYIFLPDDDQSKIKPLNTCDM